MKTTQLKRMNRITAIVAISVLALFNACQENDTKTIVSSGGDDNFTIVAYSDAALPSFTRKVEVFGIPIYAVEAVDDIKLLHAANVMAQYLDNNEDGSVDNPLVVNAMKASKAFVVMWKTESDIDIQPPAGRIGQDLGDDETQPSFVSNGKTGRFDATLEEILHIITDAGYAQAYPTVFGAESGTSLANAMDIARGGHFETVPSTYPDAAWYTYDDQTCEYECMASEYIYWGLTSILGAQENRLPEIAQEWRLNTKEKVQQTDTAIYQLLTDSQYLFPTSLPDGKYRK